MANLLWALVHLDTSLGYARSSSGKSSSSSSNKSSSSRNSSSVSKGRAGADGWGVSRAMGLDGSSEATAVDNYGSDSSMSVWLASFWAASLPTLHAWPKASLAVVAVCLARIQVCVCV